MDAIFIFLLALIYVALPVCLLLFSVTHPARALGACSVLFFLFIDNPALQRFRLLEGMIRYSAGAICSFSASSNHFVMSLEIIFLFVILLLILHHTFKMIRILPAS